MGTIAENYVGIDYHTSKVQVCVMSEAGEVLMNRSCDNDTLEVATLIGKHGGVKRVCAEACNGSAEFLDDLRKITGWQARLCHPGYVRRMKHNPDKSDKSDGELIADLDRVNYIPRVWIAPVEVRELRTLTRYREQAVERKKKAKLRIRGMLRKHRIHWEGECGLWTKAGFAWLSSIDCLPPLELWVFREYLEEYQAADSQLKRVEKKLEEFARSDALTLYLMSKPGIGLVVATTMRAEIGDFTRFRRGKELSRFCGVTPCNASSGSRQVDAGLIRAGAPILKRVIIEAAHRMMRLDPRWHAFATRMRKAEKPYPVVVASVANRWLRGLLYEVKEFQEENNIKYTEQSLVVRGGTGLESSLG